MDLLAHPELFAWLTVITTLLVPLVGFLLRYQLNTFCKVLESKVDAVDMEKMIAEKIKKSEDWSGVTFVLSKLFEQYTTETRDQVKTAVLFSSEAKKENYNEHLMLRTEISKNRETVLSEIQTGFSGLRLELTEIRKVQSNSMLELAKERRREGNPGKTNLTVDIESK
jgi:hypothetical protein